MREQVIEKKTNDKSLSRARYLDYLGLLVLRAGSGKPYSGELTGKDNTGVLRFENGYLQNLYNEDDVVTPAVEEVDLHIEYWESGLLHRVGGPAVITDFGNREEYWEYGELLLIRTFAEVRVKPA